MPQDYTIALFFSGRAAGMPLRSAACSVLLIACLRPASQPRAWAQYDVEQEDRVWVRALLDVRVAARRSRSELDRQRPGKTALRRRIHGRRIRAA